MTTTLERVFRVTIRPVATTGVRGGTATLLTPFEARAQQLVADQPDHRSYEAVPWADLNAGQREQMLLALAKAAPPPTASAA